MLFVGYYVAQDQNSLLSYSYDGNVMTIDPVSTANPGWDQFLAAYNQFFERSGRHSAVQPDLRHHARTGATGVGRPIEGLCRRAPELRSGGPASQRFISGTCSETEARRTCYVIHTLGTAQKRLRYRGDRVGLRRCHHRGPAGHGRSEPEALDLHYRARQGVAAGRISGSAARMSRRRCAAT